MKKVKAILPDIRGDKWDSYVIYAAPIVREIRRGEQIDMMTKFQSTSYSSGLFVDYRLTKEGLIGRIWIATKEYDHTIAGVQNLLERLGWLYSISSSGWSVLQKNFQGVSSDTQAPRDVTVVLAKLGAVPRIF